MIAEPAPQGVVGTEPGSKVRPDATPARLSKKEMSDAAGAPASFTRVNWRVTWPPGITGSSVNYLARVRPATVRSSVAAGLVTARPETVEETVLVVLG